MFAAASPLTALSQGSATERCVDRNVNRIAVNESGQPVRIDARPVTVAIDRLTIRNAHDIDRCSAAEPLYWDHARLTAALNELDAGEPVDVSFDGIGLFRRGRAWLLAGVAADLATRQERVVRAVTATGAELHKHYVPGRWLPHSSLAPRAPLAQLPSLAAAVYDLLPLHAQLNRAALINSATGDLWPLATLP